MICLGSDYTAHLPGLRHSMLTRLVLHIVVTTLHALPSFLDTVTTSLKQSSGPCSLSQASLPLLFISTRV